MTNASFTRDCKTLASISSSIQELKEELRATQAQIKARERGYFMPDEDDWVKRIFVAYRNYRIACYDIINRREDYEDKPPLENASSFLIGFTAALKLYEWSSILIGTFSDVPEIRRKLNEEDQRFGIEADLFDQIDHNLSRVEIQQKLANAGEYYLAWQNEFLNMFGTGTPQRWLIEEIDRSCQTTQKSTLEIWAKRLDSTLDSLPKLAGRPLYKAAYKVQSLIFDIFGNIWLDHKPQIPADHIARLETLAQPGDFFIVRPERKSSTVFLPGWWTHGALYFGGVDRIAQLRADQMPNISKALKTIRGKQDDATILEALSAGIVANRIEDSMHVDHAALFRPKLTAADQRQALEDAFGHFGKPYDFQFDFSRSDRLVCTELIYRALHGKGSVRFAPSIRLGKPTLSADDIVTQIISETLDNETSIELIAVSHKNMDNGSSAFLEGEEAFACLRRTLDI